MHAYVKEAKYLGVITCNDLKDERDILRHLRNFYARSNSIIRKFATVPWVLNYACFMHIAIQLIIVANYGLTLIRVLI